MVESGFVEKDLRGAPPFRSSLFAPVKESLRILNRRERRGEKWRGFSAGLSLFGGLKIGDGGLW
jgi:hypothetical protein